MYAPFARDDQRCWGLRRAGHREVYNAVVQGLEETIATRARKTGFAMIPAWLPSVADKAP